MTFSYKGSLSYDSPQIFRARVSGLLFVRPAWPFGVGTYGSGASQSEERSYEYDSLDRLTKITFEDGKTMEYEYDEEGNVTKITENASSSTSSSTPVGTEKGSQSA